MPELSESQLRKTIEGGSLSGLYVLYGEEKYLVSQWADRLSQKAAGKSFLDFNLQVFAGDVPAESLADAMQALPFMAERKCVRVRDLTLDGRSPSELKKLTQAFDEVPDSTVCVCSFVSTSPPFRSDKKWKALYDCFSQHGACTSFPRRKPQELERLLIQRAAKYDCILDRGAAARIVSYVGEDLSSLFNELEKVCAFTGSGPVALSAVDALVTRNLEARVYDLSRHLLAGRYAKAYETLDLLLSQNEEPVGILAVLSGTYLDLYRVRCALQSGEGVLEPANHFDYKRKEFRLKNAERDMRGLSTGQLRESLQVLLQTDLALKGARTAARIVLEEAIAKLLVIASGEVHA